ncbi:MAG: molybdopterin-binding protein [Pseudomonadota bacterium]
MDTVVGILAIGNEVVDGQITNRNASWLSQQMEAMGAKNQFHLSCCDQKEDIQRSLNFLSQSCHLVMVSGGLGPTSDDCTRQSLSDWLGHPLEFQENLWDTIHEKLSSRNLVIRDGHKNQAYIPEGATPLANSNGVAPGFFIKAQACYLASLPGPPRELQQMFTNELKPLIAKELNPSATKVLRKWICLGAPESDIAHTTETFLEKQFEIGFRLHKPYVEVKVWHDININQDQTQKLDQLKDQLAPWYVSDSLQSLRDTFKTKLELKKRVLIIDQLTQGLFLEKINKESPLKNLRYQCFEKEKQKFINETEGQTIINTMAPKKEELLIALFAKNESEALIFLNQEQITYKIPRKIPTTTELGKLYTIEQIYLNILNKK